MNRIKFLVFALVAVGLWGYHVVVSPTATLRSIEQAGGAVAGAGAAVALRIEQQRSSLQAAMVRLQANPASWNVGPKAGAKLEPPTGDRFAAVRAVLLDAVAEADRSALVVVLANDQGVLSGQGTGEPGAVPQGFDVGLVLQAGAQGSVASYGTGTYLFYATPLLISDKNEVRAAGSAVAGLPLLPDSRKLEQAARELKLTTLAIVSQNKVVIAAGPEKVQAEAAAKTIRAGQVAPLVSGPVREVGPLSLPLFVDLVPHSMGSRQALSGTPFEVIAVASTREPMEALASYQLFGLGGLVGLILLAVAGALLIKPEDDGGGRMVVPPPMPLPPPKREDAAPAPIAMAGQAAHGPEGSPDDFTFPESAVSAVHALASVQGDVPPRPVLKKDPPPAPPPPKATNPPAPISVAAPPAPVKSLPSEWGASTSPVPGPTASHPSVVGVLEPDQDPFATAAPEAAPRPASSTLGRSPATRPASQVINPFDDAEGDRTAAHSAFPAQGDAGLAGDPFAMAGGPMDAVRGTPEDGPDATRVAVVPQELIKAARQANPSGPIGDRSATRAPGAPMPRVQSLAASGADAEEKHYQEVFKDFVASREQCGEPADGLTYERFKAKLLKNREQLISKYQCKTVRFQVYVKEGKAALKASPVRE
jgi:hypothetical protein